MKKPVVVYVDVCSDSGEDASASFQKMMEGLGAKVRKTFANDVTHVIFKGGKKATLDKAANHAAKMVSVLWADECKKQNTLVDETKYLIKIDPVFGASKKKGAAKEEDKISSSPSVFSFPDDTEALNNKPSKKDSPSGKKNKEKESPSTEVRKNQRDNKEAEKTPEKAKRVENRMENEEKEDPDFIQEINKKPRSPTNPQTYKKKRSTGVTKEGQAESLLIPTLDGIPDEFKNPAVRRSLLTNSKAPEEEVDEDEDHENDDDDDDNLAYAGSFVVTDPQNPTPSESSQNENEKEKEETEKAQKEAEPKKNTRTYYQKGKKEEEKIEEEIQEIEEVPEIKTPSKRGAKRAAPAHSKPDPSAKQSPKKRKLPPEEEEDNEREEKEKKEKAKGKEEKEKAKAKEKEAKEKEAKEKEEKAKSLEKEEKEKKEREEKEREEKEKEKSKAKGKAQTKKNEKEKATDHEEEQEEEENAATKSRGRLKDIKAKNAEPEVKKTTETNTKKKPKEVKTPAKRKVSINNQQTSSNKRTKVAKEEDEEIEEEEPEEDENEENVDQDDETNDNKENLKNGKSSVSGYILITGVAPNVKDTLYACVKHLGGFKIVDSFEKRTKPTHVVCGEVRRTLNLLRGIIHSCWLVTPEWVMASLEKEKWMPEEKYLSNKLYPQAVQYRKRLLKANERYRLFDADNSKSVFVGSLATGQREDAIDLVKRIGGKIVNSALQADLCIGSYEKDVEDKSQKSVPNVRELWLYDSITQCKLLPYNDYLMKRKRGGDASPEF